MAVRYAHTNIISTNWRELAKFYKEVFDCVPVPPERVQSGQWLAEGTGVAEAELTGVHLRLPGHGQQGPTLEIYQYKHIQDKPAPAANRQGLGHLAFAVDDVAQKLEEMVARGGQALGQVTHTHVTGVGEICFVYATDPEGNIIELQKWG